MSRNLTSIGIALATSTMAVVMVGVGISLSQEAPKPDKEYDQEKFEATIPGSADGEFVYEHKNKYSGGIAFTKSKHYTGASTAKYVKNGGSLEFDNGLPDAEADFIVTPSEGQVEYNVRWDATPSVCTDPAQFVDIPFTIDLNGAIAEMNEFYEKDVVHVTPFPTYTIPEKRSPAVYTGTGVTAVKTKEEHVIKAAEIVPAG